MVRNFKAIGIYAIQHAVNQVTTTAILTLIQMVNGISVSWSASMVQKLININETPLHRVATNNEISWITNILFFGFLGGLLSSYLANRIGRRPSLILGGFLYCFTYLELTFAVSPSMIMAGRFLTGFSVTFMQVLTCAYVGEIASPNIRGTFMTVLAVFHCIGCLVGYCLGPYLSYVQFGCVPVTFTIIFILLSFYLHESPVYYVIKGNEKEAKKSLLYFGCSRNIDDELNHMFASANELALTNARWRELFIKSNRKALIVVVPLYCIEQASGIIAVMLNATAIFKEAGSSVEPAVATIIIGATNLLGSLISPFLVDIYGRRLLLFVSVGGCGLTMAVLGTYFYYRQISPEWMSSLGWLPLSALVVALFSYSVGLTSIPHTITSEMFSPNIRSLGSSIGIASASISGLLSTSIYNYLVLNVGIDVAFWTFAAFNAIGILFTAFVVPETKGKTLTEINNIMGK